MNSSGSAVVSDVVTLDTGAGGELVVQLPPGFLFTSTEITGGVDSGIMGNGIYDSGNMFFKFPALVTGDIDIVSQTLSVQAKAYWETSDAENDNLTFYGQSDDCYKIVGTTNKINGVKGAIVTANATPTACTKRGPDSYAETV